MVDNSQMLLPIGRIAVGKPQAPSINEAIMSTLLPIQKDARGAVNSASQQMEMRRNELLGGIQDYNKANMAQNQFGQEVVNKLIPEGARNMAEASVVVPKMQAEIARWNADRRAEWDRLVYETNAKIKIARENNASDKEIAKIHADANKVAAKIAASTPNVPLINAAYGMAGDQANYNMLMANSVDPTTAAGISGFNPEWQKVFGQTPLSPMYMKPQR